MFTDSIRVKSADVHVFVSFYNAPISTLDMNLCGHDTKREQMLVLHYK